MALQIRLDSEYQPCIRLLKFAIVATFLITPLTNIHILHTIPAPSYLIHHLGAWHLVHPLLPHQVDLEIIPFTDAFKPSRTSADVLFIITGCIFLLISVYRLVTRSRALSSSFLLPLAVFCSTGLSFLFALRIFIALDMPLHPTPLTHALPFLIAIIGFDKPLRIAHATFHTRLTCTLFYCNCHTPILGSPVLSILLDSLASAYPSIIRDSILEFALLTVAAYIPIGAFPQLCHLAALAVAVHCLLLSIYFTFVLSEMLSGRILKLPKDIAAAIAGSPSSPPQTPPYRYRLLSFLLGEKGLSLYNPHLKYTAESANLAVTIGRPDSEKQFSKNPSRLKLLIFTSFLLFNFITPFTPSTLSHHPINPSTSISNIDRTIPDISSPSVTAMLNALVQPDTGTKLSVKLYPQPSSPPSFTSHFFCSGISISVSRSFPFLSFTSSARQDPTTIPDPLTLSILILITLNSFLFFSLLLYLYNAVACLYRFMVEKLKEGVDPEKAKE